MTVDPRAFARIEAAATHPFGVLDLEAVRSLPDFVSWRGRDWDCSDCGAYGRGHRTPLDGAKAALAHIAHEHHPALAHRDGNGLLLGQRVHVVYTPPGGPELEDTGLFLAVRNPVTIRPDMTEAESGDHYEFEFDRLGHRVLPRAHITALTLAEEQS